MTSAVEVRIVGDRLGCDFGIIDHPEPRPDLDEIGHLMVVPKDYIDELLEEPGAYRIPLGGIRYGLHSATEHDGRLFAHHDYNGRRWTWELFRAHWWNVPNDNDMYVGRWPD